jgi:TM2 domain-containing membrane protein YozV
VNVFNFCVGYGKNKKMNYEDLKPRNRTKMALTACLGGFFGVHNFLLSNDVSGCIKIYLTLVAIIAPSRIGLSIALVDFAWILFDLWQICFLKSLPEIRFVGSRKKAAIVVLIFLTIAVLVSVSFIRNNGV